MTFSELCWWGLLAHIVADWVLQNHWMQNKTDIRHPADWVHSGIHLVCFTPVFGLFGASVVFWTHVWIDTRIPLEWWGKLIKQSTPEQCGPYWPAFQMLRDQMAHIAVIIGCAYLRSIM